MIAPWVPPASDATPMRKVATWPGDCRADALALRLTGALHALVLTGRAPALAAVYPPHDGMATDAALLTAALAALESEAN